MFETSDILRPLLAASLLCATGCADVHVEPFEDYLAGDIGRFDGFFEPAYETEIEHHRETFGTATLHGGDGYWVMARLSFSGGLLHPDLAPGAQLEFDDSMSREEGGLYVYGVGCNGDSHGRASYDSTSQHVWLQVEQGPRPDDRIVHFQMELARADEVVHGAFSYSAD